jgi:hypothetical protein
MYRSTTSASRSARTSPRPGQPPSWPGPTANGGRPSWRPTPGRPAASRPRAKRYARIGPGTLPLSRNLLPRHPSRPRAAATENPRRPPEPPDPIRVAVYDHAPASDRFARFWPGRRFTVASMVSRRAGRVVAGFASCSPRGSGCREAARPRVTRSPVRPRSPFAGRIRAHGRIRGTTVHLFLPETRILPDLPIPAAPPHASVTTRHHRHPLPPTAGPAHCRHPGPRTESLTGATR